MADVIQSLAGQLVRDKDLTPAAALSLPPEVMPPSLGFLGLREYWGSIIAVGLVDADRLGSAQIRQTAADFFQFTHALLPYAGRLRIGLATTRLGSFGLLAFVCPSGCRPDTVAAVRSGKHGSAFRKDYAVCWAIDVPARRVHAHRGLPLTMFPGRRYLERALVAA